MSLRRLLSTSISTALALGFACLVGCSAAPETAGETDEAIKNGGVSDPGETDPPPSCAYPYNEYHWTPPAPGGLELSCAALTQFAPPSRPLDRTSSFELALLNAGCHDSALGANGPAVPVGGTGWSFSICPDTCAVRTLAHRYHGTAPISSLTSNQKVNACATAPTAGHVVVLWDPHCPSSCTNPNILY